VLLRKGSGLATITIKDVAKKAGVSISTASRVFNNIPHSETVARKVMAAARSLRYQPNAIARAFRTQQTNIVGFCLFKDPEHREYSSILDMFSARLVESAESYLLEKGYSVLLSSITQQDVESFRMPKIATQGLIDGLILYGIRNAEYCSEVREVFPKMVVADHNQTNIPTIRIASYEGGEIAGRYLIKMGHKKVAAIMAETTYNAQNFIERLEGFRSVYRSAIPVFYENPWVSEGCQAVKSLLKSSDKYTAIFCGNDQIAIRTIRTLEENGLRVPQDISVIGFDDIELSRHITPSLTTISVNKQMLGEEAARMVLRLIDSPEMPALHITTPVSLVERETVAKISENILIGSV